MKTIALPQVQRQMIEEFQCSGCVSGSDTKCGVFRLEGGEDGDKGFRCGAWTPGTIGIPGGRICLGLPVGFNKTGPIEMEYIQKGGYVTLYASPADLGENPVGPANIFSGEYNKLNLPVWAMEQDGHLFVRVISPRKCLPRVQVIKGGTFAIFDKYPNIPKPINVGEFVDQID